MQKSLLFSFVFFILLYTASAQGGQGRGQGWQQQQQDNQRALVNITATVYDKENHQKIPNVHIVFIHTRDTTRIFRTTTNAQGRLDFSIPRGRYIMHATHIGYVSLLLEIRAFQEDIQLGTIYLEMSGEMLDEVTITGQTIAVTQQGDTLSFNASAYRVNPDASTEDLIRRMPGIVVDRDGVRAQGEDVRRVLVDGQEFFGDDPSIALRNLPAEMIDQIEVYDQLSDQAQLTGFDDGERIRTINIVTRADRRSGQFGRVYSGYGDTDRYQAGLVTNLFMDQRRISILGMSNNINQQNFSSEDLSGFMSEGGRGRGRRGGGVNRGDFLIGQQNGNNTTHSLGANYTDAWGDNLNLNASYFFNLSGNETIQQTDRQYFMDGDASQHYFEEGNSERNNQNHRFSARINYTINENHSMVIRPRFRFQDTHTESFSLASNMFFGDELPNESFTSNNRQWDGYSFNNSILYRARINDRGRSVSSNFAVNLSNNEYLSFLDAVREYYEGPVFTSDLTDQQSMSSTQSHSLSSGTTFNEPLGERGMLQLSYNISWSDNNSQRMTNSWDIISQSYAVFEEDLSSDINNGYLTNRLGMGYRIRGEKYHLLTHVSWQNARLSSVHQIPREEEMDYVYETFIPRIHFTYNFSRNNRIRINYRSFTSPPSVSQLQSTIDNTNPLLLRSGNPDLDQSISHTFSVRYNLTQAESSRTLSAFFNGTFTSDHIGTATTIARSDTLLSSGFLLPRGAQFSRPENLNGFANLRSTINYGFPLGFLRSNMNITAGMAYSRVPGLINNQDNLSHTYTTNGGVVLGSNISPKVDFSLAYRLNYSQLENTLQPHRNSNYFYHVSEVRFNWIFLNGWVLRNDLTNLYYTGQAELTDENFWLWNMNIGRKFLANQRGELTLGVYDLLDQNRGIRRDFSDTYTEEFRSNVLNRFFMLTFSYNIRHFGARG